MSETVITVDLRITGTVTIETPELGVLVTELGERIVAAPGEPISIGDES